MTETTRDTGTATPTASSVHNQLVADLTSHLVKSVLAAGGSGSDMMVAAESVVLGVLLYGYGQPPHPSADGAVTVLATRLHERLAENRLAHMTPAGSA